MTMWDMFRKIALGWLVLGLVILLAVVIIAINHYIFGAPMHEAHSGGRLATPTEVSETLIALGGGSFLFVLLGGGVLFWLKKR